MFGYVLPVKSELKVRELERFGQFTAAFARRSAGDTDGITPCF